MTTPANTGWVGADSARKLARILFAEPEDVYEIRGLSERSRSSGYFDNAEDFVSAAELSDRTDKRASGTFVTLNPVGPELLARAKNRIKSGAKTTTSDTDIVRRRLLLLDLDAVRPSGISATDAEKRMANERAGEVCRYLEHLGFPEPAKADSGNGAHLLLRIDLPADDGGLVKSVLEALAFRFDDDAVHVDQTVHNPSRITKLYGTRARKGDSTDDRPHRRSKLFYVPDEFQVVPEELLRRLAAMGPPAKRAAILEPGRGGQQFDVEAYLIAHQVEVLRKKPWQGGWVWVLTACIWDPSHDDAGAYVIQFANGAVAAGCHHNGCSDKRWEDFRDAREPNRQKRQKAASGSSVSALPEHPEDWPEPQPIPDELPPVHTFDLELLPTALRAWVADIADRMQCAIEFVVAAAIVSLSGVLGRRVAIRPKVHDTWTVVANLWGMAIGRPGLMKSPAVKAAFKPLHDLESEAREAHRADEKEFAAQQMVEKARAKDDEAKVKSALQKKGDALEVARQVIASKPEPPKRTRFIVNDSTVEKLGETLADNPLGLTVYRDELLGFLRGLEREGQEGARAFYLEAWDGDGSATVDRISRGNVDIPSNTLAIFGCIQPGPLGEYLMRSIKVGGGDDGLVQRFQLAVWPDPSKPWKNVDRVPDAGAAQTAVEVFRRLVAANAESTGADPNEGGIPFLRFDTDAQEVFDAWRGDLELRIRKHEESPAFESHIAKFRSLVPSLALLFHLADVGEGPVQRASVERAIRMCSFLEAHARRIYHCAMHSETPAAIALSKKLIGGKLNSGFVARDVYRNNWSGLTDRKVVQPGIDLLVDLDWLVPQQRSTLGRDKVQYFINPRILQTRGEGTAKGDKSPSGSSVSAAASGSREVEERNQAPGQIEPPHPAPGAIGADFKAGEDTEGSAA